MCFVLIIKVTLKFVWQNTSTISNEKNRTFEYQMNNQDGMINRKKRKIIRDRDLTFTHFSYMYNHCPVNTQVIRFFNSLQKECKELNKSMHLSTFYTITVCIHSVFFCKSVAIQEIIRLQLFWKTSASALLHEFLDVVRMLGTLERQHFRCGL